MLYNIIEQVLLIKNRDIPTLARTFNNARVNNTEIGKLYNIIEINAGKIIDEHYATKYGRNTIQAEEARKADLEVFEREVFNSLFEVKLPKALEKKIAMFYESLMWSLPMDKSSTIEKFFWFWEYKMIFINK